MSDLKTPPRRASRGFEGKSKRTFPAHILARSRIKQTMNTIGIYDSGIGGLTVLKEILKRFAGNAIYYYADNLNAPFGNLDDGKLALIAAEGLANVQANSDVTVIACNTVSTLLHMLSRGTQYEDKTQNNVFIVRKCVDKPSIKPIIGILPPVEAYNSFGAVLPYEPNKTLLLATQGTLRHIAIPHGMQIASTPQLATIIERTIENGENLAQLYPYLQLQLKDFVGVKNVILGCTHYPLCKMEISKILGRVRFYDGTTAVLNALQEFVTSRTQLSAPINFAFSGKDESEKYSRMLETLVNCGG